MPNPPCLAACYDRFVAGEAHDLVLPEEALVRAGLALVSDLSLPSVLEKIVELACSVSGARYGALGVIAPDRTIEEFVAYGISAEERAAIGPLPHGRGILGALIEEGRTLRLPKLQDDPRSVGFPPNHPPMETFLGVPVRVRGLIFGNLYLTEKRGGEPFTQEDEDAVVRLATYAAVAVHNARLYRDAEAARSRMEAVQEVTAAILAGRERDDVLSLVASHARHLAGAALATIVVPSGAKDLVVRVAVGERADELRGMRFAASESASGAVMNERRPVLIPDASSDSHVSQPIVGIGGFGPALLVPLAAGRAVFGTLCVANTRGGASFTEDHRSVLETFAGQAAVAIDYANIRAELDRLVVVDERERIAKELHDDIIQSLFAEGMSLQALEAIVTDDAVRTRLSQSVDNLDRVIRDLRNYIFGLRPGAAADRHLDAALRALAADFGEGSGIAIDVVTDPDAVSHFAGRAPDIVSFAREAISNAVRHSGGRRIDVSFAVVGVEAVLEIADNGTGFDLAAAQGKGHGLVNLRDRGEAVGGRFEIDTASGGGTCVRLRMPI